MVQNIAVHLSRRLYGILKQYMNAKTLLFLRIIHTKHSIEGTVQRDGSGRIRLIRMRMRLFLTYLALRKHNLNYVAKPRGFHFLADLIQLGILFGLDHQMIFFWKAYEI